MSLIVSKRLNKINSKFGIKILKGVLKVSRIMIKAINEITKTHK